MLDLDLPSMSIRSRRLEREEQVQNVPPIFNFYCNPKKPNQVLVSNSQHSEFSAPVTAGPTCLPQKTLSPTSTSIDVQRCLLGFGYIALHAMKAVQGRPRQTPLPLYYAGLSQLLLESSGTSLHSWEARLRTATPPYRPKGGVSRNLYSDFI